MASPTVAAAAPSASVSQTPAEKAAAAAAKAAKALRKCAPDLSPSRSSAPKAAFRPSDWRADLFSPLSPRSYQQNHPLYLWCVASASPRRSPSFGTLATDALRRALVRTLTADLLILWLAF